MSRPYLIRVSCPGRKAREYTALSHAWTADMCLLSINGPAGIEWHVWMPNTDEVRVYPASVKLEALPND